MDQAVSVGVGVENHLIDIRLFHLLAEVRHDVSKLHGRDDPEYLQIELGELNAKRKTEALIK